MTRRFWPIIARDLKIQWRSGGGSVIGLVFFLGVVSLFPFALGPDGALLERVAPAIVWIAALLSTLLGLDRLFQADHEDGSLDLIQGSDMSLEAFVLAKVAGHWLAADLPLIVATPLLGILLNLPQATILGLMGTLVLGTPALTFIGAVGAAITAGLKRAGLLLVVLVLPLSVPLIIFGIGALTRTEVLVEAVMVLAGLTLTSGVLGTLAAAAALRLSFA